MLRRAAVLVLVLAAVGLYTTGAVERAVDWSLTQLQQPWLPGVGALVLVVVLARAAIALRRRAGDEKDPVRMYPSKVRAAVFERAGGQCEYTGWAWQRCRAAAEHADHIVPWSKGGATSLQNGAASCAHHNTSKGSKLLTRRQLRGLERRRRRYFPAGSLVHAGQRYGEPDVTTGGPPPPSPRTPHKPAEPTVPSAARGRVLDQPGAAGTARPSWEYERPSW